MTAFAFPRELRRALSIGVTLAAIVAITALIPAGLMHERRMRQMKEDLLDELGRVQVLDLKARSSLADSNGDSGIDGTSELSSPDGAASAAHIQAVVHQVGVAPIVIASIRTMPALPGPILQAARATVELTGVPEGSLGSVVTGLEHATPPIVIESLRIAAGDVSPGGASETRAVQITATIRSYYRAGPGGVRPGEH